jgi:hypothetical protein
MKARMTLLILFLMPSSLLAGDDFQYWSRMQVKAIDTRYVDYINYWDLRFYEGASHLGFWQTSQKVQVDAFENLGFGAAYTYLEAEAGSSELKYQHRLELEALPRWKFGRININNRDRFEFRWIEGKGSDNGRFRQLWEFEFPFKAKSKPLAFYCSNEFFLDCKARTINENQVVPAGIVIPLSRRSSLKVFYMLQSRKKDTWSSSHILGTHLSFAL